MNKLFYIFISTILIFSASNKNTEQTPFDLFTKKVHIQCQKIETESEFIGKGGEMIFFEKPQQLIIHDWTNTEYLLKRISLNDGNNVSQFASAGNGPEEFIHLNLGQKLSDSSFLIQDIDRGLIYEMNVNTGYLNQVFDYQGDECFDIIRLKHSYIGTGIFSKGMFALWKKDSLSPSKFVYQYPDDGTESNTPSKAMAYQGKMLKRNSQDRFVFASSGCAYFEIFKLDSDSLISVKKQLNGQFEYAPSTGNNIYAKIDSKNSEGYVDAYTTEKYIYLLYSGRVSQNSDLESIERSILSNHILVFTWDGEPVVEYETDVDLKNFCVSDSDDILYAIAYTPDPQLVSFVLEQ